MFLAVIELALLPLLIWFACTQVVLPILKRTTLLPMFNKRRAIEQKIEEARETLDEIRLEKELGKIKQQVKAEKK